MASLGFAKEMKCAIVDVLPPLRSLDSKWEDSLVLYNLGPHESHERPANFVRSLYKQKHYQSMKTTETRRI